MCRIVRVAYSRRKTGRHLCVGKPGVAGRNQARGTIGRVTPVRTVLCDCIATARPTFGFSLLRSSSSVVPRLCLDDVGIGAGATDVDSSDPVVVGRIGSQAGHIPISHVTYVAIPIGGNVSNKGIACGDV